MQIFQYNKSALAPLDHYVVKIYKEFKNSLHETLDLWMGDFQSGIVAMRDYVDFANARMEVHLSKDGAVPVIKFKPIVDEQSEATIRKHQEFFKAYMELRDLLNGVIRSHLSTPKKVRPAHRTAISLYNALKFSIHVFLLDKFDYLDFIPVLEDPNSEIAATILREVGSGEIIGEKFEAGGMLYEDHPGKPFISYIHYVRNQMIRERDEAVKNLPGWILESK